MAALEAPAALVLVREALNVYRTSMSMEEPNMEILSSHAHNPPLRLGGKLCAGVRR